jgi:signal transduction histidine kinase
MVLAQVGARVTFELGVVRLSLPTQWDPDLFVLLVTFGVYAIALFGFHALDPVPGARRAALATMRDGMVVVDRESRIVDVNASARQALGERREALLARPLGDVLPLAGLGPSGGGPSKTNVDLDGEGGLRRYLVETTPLDDRSGRPLGGLILLHDVTEQERTQTRLLEQERVVATLKERERLARELHDSVGQVLGYLSMQAQTASKRLRDGDAGKAEELLSRLASVAQHAHADVRESILALHTASSGEWAFLTALRHYLKDFETQYGVTTTLTADGVVDDTVPPHAGVQVLRVIQEAMTNARRHGRAATIGIELERSASDVLVRVVDDGDGFDPSTLGTDGGHFGLGFMRERMAQIAGDVTIESSPGAGTTVRLTAPLDQERKEEG